MGGKSRISELLRSTAGEKKTQRSRVESAQGTVVPAASSGLPHQHGCAPREQRRRREAPVMGTWPGEECDSGQAPFPNTLRWEGRRLQNKRPGAVSFLTAAPGAPHFGGQWGFPHGVGVSLLAAAALGSRARADGDAASNPGTPSPGNPCLHARLFWPGSLLPQGKKYRKSFIFGQRRVGTRCPAPAGTGRTALV